MRSHIFLRAGLVTLTITLCALFTSAVPVPSISLSCSQHPRSCLIAKRDRSQALERRSEINFDLPSRSFPTSSEHLILREYTDDTVTLFRRKSIFTKIKEAFQKVGHGIKSVAQKIGKGIKNVAKKIGNGIKTAAKKVASGVKTAAKKIGNGVKTAAKKVASGVKTAVKKIGEGVKTAAKKVASGVKTAAKKVASGVKTAVKKVGHFVKTTGAKIAKFGLKIVSTAQSLASKVAKFIPIIGKPISAALTAASTATNAASNAIHANLGSKLEKGMKVMDKIRNPVSGAAGVVIGALKRDFDEPELEVLSRDWDPADLLEMRDFYAEERSSWDEFEERDQEPYELDAREDSYDWKAREWNEWEERGWEQWDTREWEDSYSM